MSRYLVLVACVGCSAPNYGPATADTKIELQVGFGGIRGGGAGFALHGTSVVYNADDVTEAAELSTDDADAMITALEDVEFLDKPDSTDCGPQVEQGDKTISVDLSVGTKRVHYLDDCQPEGIAGLVSRLSEVSGFSVWISSHME